MRTVERQHYKVEYNDKTGEITGLYDRINPVANWKAESEEKKLGTVFIHGTQWSEDEIPFGTVEETKEGLRSVSETGMSEVQYRFKEDCIHIEMKTCKDCGPRTGLQMNLNLLDLPTKETWKYQCMPKVIYTDDSYSYAYFVFATADGRFMGMTIDKEFAAWRIKYSYEGHKMTGFQVLSEADDVKCPKGTYLPDVDHLSITLFFAETLRACLEKMAIHLGIELVIPEVSAGIEGGTIPYTFVNSEARTKDPVVIAPDHKEKTLDILKLEQAGGYQIKTIGTNGREHITRVFCHNSWKEMFDKVNNFYREHFQDACGAFYRVISKDTLKPDALTFEGVDFGDPLSHWSCRTGEFGGFAGWAMMKNCLLFGKDEKLMESAGKYLLNWALNRMHEDAPYYGTVYKKENEYMGRKYGSYHLYEEMNYVQHEMFLLEEMADYVRLTNDGEVMEDAIGLAEHVIAEHLENGVIINENIPGEKVDYSTVHSAISGFLAIGKLLKEQKNAKADKMYTAAEEIADHVCRRAFDFPTEGEPCTEDGSMSCSVITLLRAYLEIAPKKEYLEIAEQLLKCHTVLEMDGADCRMRNSSICFWETQYESNDWGASINAGHGWSIWNAEAKALYARITRNFTRLKESYEGFVTNMCKVEPTGGMSCSFTPDMIPGTPHAYFVNNVRVPDKINEVRPTSTHLGNRYVPKTYSVSGNFFLIRGAETFGYMSGFDCGDETAINGKYHDGMFESAAPEFNYFLLKGVPEELVLKVKINQAFIVAVDGETCDLVFENADLLEKGNNEVVILPADENVVIRRNLK